MKSLLWVKTIHEFNAYLYRQNKVIAERKVGHLV